MDTQCTQCGTKIRPDSISEWWCSPECQQDWQRKGFDAIPVPARPEWRMGTRAENERDWPAPRIVPHPDGGVTMTSQAQENPAPTREPGGVSDQPTAIAGLGFTEFGERTDRPIGIIRRILGATRSTT